MFKTIRSKLLVILLIFALTTFIASVVAFSYFEKSKASLSEITERVENTHLLLLKDIKVTHEFFENETINPAFFESGNSNLISEHEKICSGIDRSFSQLFILEKKNNFGLSDSIDYMKRDFAKYKIFTDQIIKQILERGFKDYGIEGRMREHAHKLENYQSEIGLVNILQLRRHEKDFIIRQESPYVVKHNELIKQIRDKLTLDNSVSLDKKSEILAILNNYSTEFNILVAYERKLGLKSGEGLKKRIDSISNKIETSLASLVEFSKKKEAAALDHVKLFYTIIGCIFILISIVSALIISKRISRSITHLKEKIDEFVKSDFTVRTILPLSDSVNEIDILATNFSIMEQHIVDQMKSLKQTNKDLEMLFYVTSHDIRAPLIKVKELTDIAFIKTKDTEAKDYFFRINQSWERLLNIIDELGIVTNVRSVDIKTEPIDLEELIHSVFQEFRSLQWFNNIVFSLELRMENKFFSSPGLIRAIFRNLIENSIKYATKRASFNFLKISIVDQNDEMLRIEVSDNGIGIKKEYHDKIFDMFFRGTSYASGTGLGLYIVQCSLEKLNGAISVESSEDKGTTFTLLLPNNYRKKSIKESIIHKREIYGMTNQEPSHSD